MFENVDLLDFVNFFLMENQLEKDKSWCVIC